ncbi:sec1 family transporter sly1 [Plasmopara halstedii]|uniref:Sec1 family transporter sly1 n=1 Tax=Plasmopara halstedii TaxID=4781 RepID=A0A0P1B1M4_PLAHL|nr:sec1 family transporter sly1 [Plasmopara halstedii]CEG47256.1 sec1 family transporter sly1 [Plasmopara halstedii]|eukprot:XP_024583625.1 sec1 family transporter sly1 [Plasmopara halstedii]
MIQTASLSLQEKQRENLLRMLDFNSESTNSFADTAQDSIERWGDQWKVLIYDRFCRDIISPILKLHELRKKGVTLHMLLDTERDSIPDVPAIYFVEPTRTNLERIVSDCTKELYSSVHLNFAYPLSRESLEFLARASVEAQCTSMIAKVYDQYTNFVSLEPTLFSLNLSESYRAYNDPNVADVQIEETMNVIVKGLFSVLVTLGSIPVIRSPNNDGPSRMVAEQLSSMIRDHLNLRNGVFTESTSNFQRPLLIIMDRNEDIASGLHHPSTYQALVDDILSIQMNRVKVSVKSVSGDDGGNAGRTTERTYDLDVTGDKFFERHAGSLFPDAIDANEEEMKQVTRKEEQIRAQTGGNDAFINGTKDLVAAVDTLPALVEKKKMLEVHTNIFHAAFDGVTKRHIPSYSMLEQKLIDGLHVDKAEVLQLLSSTQMGTLADKMRLLIIYFLSSGVSGTELAEFENAYKQCAAASEQPEAYMQAWKFLRKHSAFQRRASVGASLQSESGTGPDGGVNMSRFKGLAQGFLAQATASFKNFMPENKKLHVTRVTDALSEMKPNSEDDRFLYLDPKIKASGDVPRQRTPFREVMVFMIGGGNYNEYHNLMAYAKGQQPPRSIWYGCTEVLNPEAFLHQLGSIGI